jgi:hypothetical protein
MLDLKPQPPKILRAWRWYSLDLYSNTLPDLIKNEKVLVIGNDPVEGVAIINQDRRWNKDNNIFQIVYLDASNVFMSEDLVTFAIDLMHCEGEIYNRIQIFSPQVPYASTVMEQFGLGRSEQFVLYSKEI